VQCFEIWLRRHKSLISALVVLFSGNFEKKRGSKWQGIDAIQYDIANRWLKFNCPERNWYTLIN
jgi:hypothetical protein